MTDDIDPVTLEVLWSRLRGIPREMGTHLSRTAFSAVMKYARDYSTALFTANGRLISQGVRAPGHLGSMPFMVKTILEDHFPRDSWDPGDVVLTNDPYINSGHLPDLFLFLPVFDDDTLAGFCVVGGHHLDIGGSGPASYSMYASDIYAEGLQIPPIKLYEQHQLNDEVISIITENSRESNKIRGDLQAQYGAANVGHDLFLEVLAEWGRETLEQYVEEIIRRSESRVRQSIRELPDGTYTFSETFDGFDEPLPIRAQVTVSGSDIHVDYTGTARQQHGRAINSVLQYTFSYTMLALKSVLDPDMPQTEGTLDPITITAPEGSLLNPRPPVPVSARQLVSDFIVGTVRGALHEAVPGEISAAGGQQLRHMFQFTDEDAGTQQVLFDGHYGGAGARPDRDGSPAVAGSNNLTNTPVEAIEAEYPMRITRYELASDSGGAGEHRGGNGTVREYEFHQKTTVQLVNERFRVGPYGLAGGERGQAGAAEHISDRHGTVQLSSKERFSADPGETLRVRSTGGGGYGAADARSTERVRADVDAGQVSPERAEETYGVRSDSDARGDPAPRAVEPAADQKSDDQ